VGAMRNQVDLGRQSISFSTTTLLGSEFTGSSNNFYINGGTTPSSAASSGPFSITKFGIGYLADFGSTGDAAYWNGTLSECIVYFGSLTATQRQQVEGYLAIKWGLQGNLPSTHPFANRGLPSTHPYKTISPI